MNDIKIRLIHRIKRSLRPLGFFSIVRQVQIWTTPKKAIGRLLIIAPGNVHVPPEGWGAVETIIQETIGGYVAAGLEVCLVNSKALADWYQGWKFKPDVVLVHDDISTRRAAILFRKAKVIAITHYGLAEFPELWHRSYKQVLRSLNWADVAIALNPRIKEVLESHLSKPRVVVSSNGTSFTTAASELPRSKLVCIGKVEPRKRQFELFNELECSSIFVDFIGEIFDQRVLQLTKRSKLAQKQFLGPYSRAELQKVLPEYAAIILVSDGEADALVLYEAQIAGLSVIVSEGAKGDQDETLPWILVMEKNFTAEEIESFIRNQNVSRQEISKFATENYNWTKRNSRLLDEVTFGLKAK